MMKAAILLMVSLGLLLAQAQMQPHGQQKENVGQMRQGEIGEHDRSLFESPRMPFQKELRGSVLSSTHALFSALQRHEPGAVMAHFSPKTKLVYNSELPAGGIYHGLEGLVDFAYKCRLTFHMKESSFKILFVDEANGFSVVETTFSGRFNRTGAEVKDLKTTSYIAWLFGKVDKWIVVDNDYAKLVAAYRTKAEKTVHKFYQAIFRCAGAPDQESKAIERAVKLLADDITVRTNIYPKQLGQIMDYKGKEQAAEALKLRAKLLNLTDDIKVLFADDSTVVTMYSLRRPLDTIAEHHHTMKYHRNNIGFLPVLGNSKLPYHVLFDVVKVNDQGLITSCEQTATAPIMPWNLPALRKLGLPVDKINCERDENPDDKPDKPENPEKRHQKEDGKRDGKKRE